MKALLKKLSITGEKKKNSFQALPKEDKIRTMIEKFKGKKFLEIGVGPKIQIDRYETLRNANISWTGVDFHTVCKKHQDKLQKENFSYDKLRYIGNDEAGSYLFNLIDLKNNGEQFDLIYFDGHHTMNIDAAPMVVSTMLVKNGGTIIFDDVRWTLEKAKGIGIDKKSYKKVYTDEQYKSPHIKIIIESILEPLFDMRLEEGLSVYNWKVYRVFKKK